MHEKVDGNLVPLPTLILTFDLVKLPSVVKAAWLQLHVKPYVPTPKCCYHCQRFDHILAKCWSKLKIFQELASIADKLHIWNMIRLHFVLTVAKVIPHHRGNVIALF